MAYRSPADADLTARARIRDAALVRFGTDGVAATTLKAIAEDAGVSAQLIVHHYGSKDGLAEACDEHVLAVIREQKERAMARGLQQGPLAALRDGAAEPSLLRYLARRLADDSPQVDRLVDQALEDMLVYDKTGIDSGVLTPLGTSRDHAVVLLLWNLGAAVLHRHAKRLLGVDILSGDPAEQIAWLLPAAEILAGGVMTPEAVDQLRQLAAETQAPEGMKR